jgi:predicted DNA-binding protein (MmcQ/YjbR family)
VASIEPALCEPALEEALELTLDGYNRFCGELPHTTHVVQWGDADVWKVAGKVFSIARWGPREKQLYVTFKVSELGFEIMKEMPGLRPAPYLASRGLKWIQRVSGASMSDKDLKQALRDAHRLIAAGLPKKTRLALGFEPPAPAPAPTSTRTGRTNRASR